MIRRFLLLAPLLAATLLAPPARAQSTDLPRQVEFYFDADASTLRPVLDLKDPSPAVLERLTRTVERRPQDSALEAAQLAHYAMRNGQLDVGRDLYARALARIDLTNGLWKPVKWTYGWDLYRAGDTAAALRQWGEVAHRSGTASWMPPTLALGLWTAGRRDEAVRWYAAAVRTEPGQWSTPARYAQLLPQWREAERAALAEVQAAWAARPPSWP